MIVPFCTLKHPERFGLVEGTFSAVTSVALRAMLTELFFLFSCIWQHRFYYLFGMMLTSDIAVA